MRNTLGRVFLLLALGVLGACSDAVPGPVSPGAATPVASLSDRWNIADVEADFPGLFSFDTTWAGSQAPYYVAPVDDTSGDSERTFCRDHFKPIDLWWDGGYGNMQFHLDPPLLFVGYRTGTYRSPRGLVFRKAVYETFQTSEAVDPSGNVWRFTGRFNALCRGGELEIGPVVFGGQLLVSQDPVTLPVLVRRGTSGGSGDGCGGYGGADYPTSVAPADPEYALSDDEYDPYSPACGGSGSPGTGVGDGGMTFPEMCSSLGGKLYYDYPSKAHGSKSSGSPDARSLESSGRSTIEVSGRRSGAGLFPHPPTSANPPPYIPRERRCPAAARLHLERSGCTPPHLIRIANLSVE